MKKIITKLVFTGLILRHKTKLKMSVQRFAENMKLEASETKQASALFAKHMKGEKLTKEESEVVRKQFYDVLKVVGIGVPMILIPGGTVIIAVIIKFAGKYNINLKPSSFDGKHVSGKDEVQN